MSVELAIGLEYNTKNELSGTYGTTISVSTTQKRTGSYSLLIARGGWAYYGTVTFTARDEYYIQICIYPANVNLAYGSGTTGGQFLRFKSGSTVLIGIAHDYGILRAYTGDYASLVATGINQVQTNTWQVLQVYVKIADSGGRIVVKLDNNTEIDYTGDTKPGSETTINGFDLCGFETPSTGTNHYFDDIVIFNTLGSRCNSWPNGVPVHVMRPNAAGNYAQWTPSAGSNYQCVDELPPTATDYVYTNTNAQKDTYNFPDADVALASGVTAIIADYWGQSVGAPAVTQIKRLIRISSVDYEGSGIALEPTFNKHTDVVELNPADSQPWEKSDLDGLELGMTSLT